MSNLSEEENKAIGEIDISKTIESNINYWRNKCLEQQKEIEQEKEKNKFMKENIKKLTRYKNLKKLLEGE